MKASFFSCHSISIPATFRRLILCEKTVASFSTAIPKVLAIEGGYQNDPADKGNYNAYTSSGQYVAYANRRGYTLRAGTNRGISAGLYSSLLKREVSVAEMQAITEDQAIYIYRQVFWDSMLGDQIRSQALAELIFDSHVNHSSTGIRLVQRVLNHLGFDLVEDGKLGPNTLAAINSADTASLYNGILTAREQFYRSLVANDPSQGTFLQGWLNRLRKFPAMAIQAAKDNPLSIWTGVAFAALLWLFAKDSKRK